MTLYVIGELVFHHLVPTIRGLQMHGIPLLWVNTNGTWTDQPMGIPDQPGMGDC